MHSYVLTQRVSHADVDLLGELKVSALLGLLERAAVEASWDCGFDPAWYAAEGRVWIVRRTRLERRLPVGGGDLLRVTTRVLDWRRARSLRAYEVRRVAAGQGTAHGAHGGEDEPLVALATTDWVYCDVARNRPASVPDEMRRRFSGDGPVVTLPRARALPDAGPGDAVAMSLTVRPSLLDHVAHVNNAAYASLLEDGAFELFATHGATVERMLAHGGALRLRALDVEYLDDAGAGDELVVRSWRLPRDGEAVDAPGALWPPGAGERPRDARLLQVVERTGDGPIVRAQSDWTWRERPGVLGGVPER